jgi:hypothetical protein
MCFVFNWCPMQGSLPMLNQEAVNLAIRAGIALNANIARRSKFDRKQYFYADLPKGYQIRWAAGDWTCSSIAVRLRCSACALLTARTGREEQKKQWRAPLQHRRSFICNA